MDITQIVGYIQLVPLGVCLCIGYLIKHAVPNDEVNRYIPIAMAFTGLVVEVWMVGAFTPETVLTGMVSGLASSGLYDAFANIIDKGQGADNQ